MSSEEDNDLKLLRSALLSSIREKKSINKSAREIYDTDIDDLEALRQAALRSVRHDANISSSSQTPRSPVSIMVRPPQAGKQNQLTNNQLASSNSQPRLPQFRLRPQPRSNLIVIQTMPEERASQSPKLLLPQDRYCSQPASDSASVSKTKKIDKWSRYEKYSVSSDEEATTDNDDGEDEEVMTVDFINSDKNSISDGEIGENMARLVNNKDTQIDIHLSDDKTSRQIAADLDNNNSHKLSDDKLEVTCSTDVNSSPTPLTPTVGISMETAGQSADGAPIKTSPPAPDSSTPQSSSSNFDDDDDNFDDLLLTEPLFSVEFLDDDVPIDYKKVLANVANAQEQQVGSTSSTAGGDNTGSSTRFADKENNHKKDGSKEKERIQSKLNEIERKLAEIYGGSGGGGGKHSSSSPRNALSSGSSSRTASPSSSLSDSTTLNRRRRYRDRRDTYRDKDNNNYRSHRTGSGDQRKRVRPQQDDESNGNNYRRIKIKRYPHPPPPPAPSTSSYQQHHNSRGRRNWSRPPANGPPTPNQQSQWRPSPKRAALQCSAAAAVPGGSNGNNTCNSGGLTFLRSVVGLVKREEH